MGGILNVIKCNKNCKCKVLRLQLQYRKKYKLHYQSQYFLYLKDLDKENTFIFHKHDDNVKNTKYLVI